MKSILIVILLVLSIESRRKKINNHYRRLKKGIIANAQINKRSKGSMQLKKVNTVSQMATKQRQAQKRQKISVQKQKMKKKMANEIYILPPDSKKKGSCLFYQMEPCFYVLNSGLSQPDECKIFTEKDKFKPAEYMLYQPNQDVFGSEDHPEKEYQRIWYFNRRPNGQFFINTMPDLNADGKANGEMGWGKFYCRIEGDINNLHLKLMKMGEMKGFMTEPVVGFGQSGDKNRKVLDQENQQPDKAEPEVPQNDNNPQPGDNGAGIPADAQPDANDQAAQQGDAGAQQDQENQQNTGDDQGESQEQIPFDAKKRLQRQSDSLQNKIKTQNQNKANIKPQAPVNRRLKKNRRKRQNHRSSLYSL